LKFSNSDYSNFGYFNIADPSGNLYYNTPVNSSNTQLTFSESKEQEP
jgi:hypothetical protein